MIDTEHYDMTISQKDRSDKGAFFTPKPFVEYAQDMISKTFGEDWRSKYVVWDCACGTKNLTKDYIFNELYSSTLDKHELEISANYNTNSTAFQFDFLNEPLEGNLLDGCKIPKGLQDALRNDKPIMFFINPPYAAGGSGVGKSKEEGTAKSTNIAKQMGKDGINGQTQNLYTQFLYRILLIKRQYNLNNVCICIFSPTLFLTGTAYKKFRMKFFDNFEYVNGVQFPASEFSDVADNWGIGFTIWKNGKTQDMNNFELLNIHKEGNHIIEDNVKDIYNLDGIERAGDWVNEPIALEKRFNTIELSSGIKVSEKGIGTIAKNSLGSFVNAGNNIDMNTQHVALFSSAYSNWGNISILPQNFTRCTSLFAARKLIEKNWQNSADEYMAPDTNSKYWQEFENDSIIYSLFHSSSNQSSLRQVEYKGKLWDIKNEFFWNEKELMKSLSMTYDNNECLNDCLSDNEERYVCKLINSIHLTPEANDVLVIANLLLVNSFKYRIDFNNKHPEYQINNWDCGYYQLKELWKIYMQDEFMVLKEKMRVLSDKMRPLVYEVGFLKNS